MVSVPGTDVVKMVLVEWVDSCEPDPNAEVERHELPGPQRIYQCGFLVKEDGDHIVVAGASKPQLETFDYVIAIPRCAVVNMQEVVTEKPAKKSKS